MVLFYCLMMLSSCLACFKMFFIAGYLGPENFSFYANINASIVVVIYLITLGMSETLLREAVLEANIFVYYSTVKTLLGYSFLSVVSIIVTMFLGYYLFNINERLCEVIIFSICFSYAMFLINIAVLDFRVCNEYNKIAYVLCLKSLCGFLALAICQLIEKQSWTLIVGVEAGVASILIYIVRLQQIISKGSFDFHFLRGVYKSGLKIGANSLIRNAVLTIQRWLIVIFLGAKIAGVYTFAMIVYQVGLSLANPIIMYLTPYCYKLVSQKRDYIILQYLKDYARYVIPICALAFLIGYHFMCLIIDNFFIQYKDAAPLMPMVQLFVMAYLIVIFFETVLIGMKKETAILNTNLCIGFVNIACFIFGIMITAELKMILALQILINLLHIIILIRYWLYKCSMNMAVVY